MNIKKVLKLHGKWLKNEDGGERADLWGADLNCIFYKTKVTKKQEEQIYNSDLFEVVD